MKAPNKIYLAESDKIKGEVISNFASSTPFRKHDSVEYIRKDALLEWAKRQKVETEEAIKQHPEDDSVWAELHWWEDIIDKIKSL